MNYFEFECKNCRQQVSYTENNRCEKCNIANWGYSSVQKWVDSNPTFNNYLDSTLKEENQKLNQLTNIRKDKEKKIIDFGQLIMETNDNEKTIIKLHEGVQTIGRDIQGSTRDILIPNDQHVSRNHGRLEVKLNINANSITYIFTDNDLQLDNSKGSKNGSYLNESNKRVAINQKINLKNGDFIKIGNAKFTLEAPIESKLTGANISIGNL